MNNKDYTIGVVGLGYVGLPVAVEFAKTKKVIGFDTKERRILELKENIDRNNEISSDELKEVSILYTSDPKELSKSNFFIVTVPTPISKNKTPDLTALKSATKMVGSVLKKNDIVVYESTVYPGVTEEICLPILEKESSLKLGEDFKLGYSPERINPGDKVHSFTKIKKVVSGSDEKALREISELYSSVVTAGVFEAKNIKVAEAAKVIENTQRDINIAFMNELSLIFERLDINTRDVLDAASTKWNFLNFYPGLVGGHCIGVDPYYLTYRAQEFDYIPEIILAGRRINDNMPKKIVTKLIKLLIKSDHVISKTTATIMGLTFKENTPDIRNSKVFDIFKELSEFGINVQLHDPVANSDEVKDEFGVELTSLENLAPADVVILAVNHEIFSKLNNEDLSNLTKSNQSIVVNINSWLKGDDLSLISKNHFSI